ncbi:aldolase [Arthrobacter sp. SF27]|nr:aldolase [Arthrobacter sp. SF27]
MENLLDSIDRSLWHVDARLRTSYPGDRGTRQPVHTCYIPADTYHPGIPGEWGREATEVLDSFAGTADALASIINAPLELASEVLPLVRAKLAREPIEDLRLDFEDGFGSRSDDAENAAVEEASASLKAAIEEGEAPTFFGIRFKSFEEPTRRRGIQTFARFVGLMVTDGRLPEGFTVTLPKVTAVEQVEAMVAVCEHLENSGGLSRGALRFEIQVETPQSILSSDGTAAVARMIAVASGRCSGLHYGAYDYSAACGIAAEHQSMAHPVADHAKAVMQVAAAGTGVRLSDGASIIFPVGSDDEIRFGLRHHAQLVERSLHRGYYQGWDMHPAQLVTRYAVTFAFYRRSFAAAARRIAAYTGGPGAGASTDEPATARALAWFIIRGLQCGALSESEVEGATGLSGETLDSIAFERTNLH